MISKNRVKLIRSLEKKKQRNELGLFLAEGNKLVADMLPAFEAELILAKSSWLATQGDLPARELLDADEEDIRKASLLKNPQDVIAVFRQPDWSIETVDPAGQLVLALDGVQDPGNLGTIIRIADWFGLESIVCSPDTADLFNPKVVQATMGALARVKVFYTDLTEWLSQQQEKGVSIYGTLLDGEDIYRKKLTETGILIMGNEGKGISPEIEALVNEKLFIPSYPAGRDTSESLNVATATAIVCAEFRRRSL
ncbi:TrmH family RNA methyltransferase [Parabacteroides sp. PFB2-12]|uniref:TrmH family RNA methyltransferase n=1 Tax=unclassified Parabacteroides TaxID=2649774 RepID=UPI002472F4DF|nr:MULTISPECIES: RNA methyltransferase [unclassified Parabacteroides]MDH6342383.1 TrmH family RNA methyltransferase [Parabacteroides sp. PM6-13]MDH6390035.1 TrmH family RNA methyltransferase [Parabacteroides sp. PFB2-12]